MDDSKDTDNNQITDESTKTRLSKEHREDDVFVPSASLKVESTEVAVENALHEADKFKATSSPHYGWRERMRKLYANLPHVYTVEFTVYLLVSLAILVLTNFLWRGIIDGFGKPDGQSLFGAQFTYNSSVAVIAATVVLLPFLLWFLMRVNRVETSTPQVKDHRVRKWLLGIFLVVLSIAAIASAVSLVQGIFGTLANAGLATEDKQPQLWKTVLKEAFAFLLFASTAIIYARDFRYDSVHDHERTAWFKRLLHKFLAVVALVVLIGFISFPLMKQCASFVDGVISKDLSTIINKIYNAQPSRYSKAITLGDLKLDERIKARAEKYNYTLERKKKNAYNYYYELCADFKTDTKSNADQQKPAPIELLSRASDSNKSSGADATSYRMNEEDTNLHSKGRSCFKVYDGQSTYDDYNSPSSRSDSEVIVN